MFHMCTDKALKKKNQDTGNQGQYDSVIYLHFSREKSIRIVHKQTLKHLIWSVTHGVHNIEDWESKHIDI